MTGLPCDGVREGGFAIAPEWNDLPRVARDHRGRPGDPVNLAVAGETADIEAAFAAAGWFQTSRETLGAALRSVGAYTLKRPYRNLPISHLWLLGRPQDIAFAKPVGRTISQRHHVRFWRTPLRLPDGRPVWLGAASFDIAMHRVSVLHRIAPEVDIERDDLIANLEAAGVVAERCQVGWADPTEDGHNAAGDPYCTDGALGIAVLRPAPSAGEEAEAK